MRSLSFLSALLLAGGELVACQPSSYVLVQLDGVPESARSVKLLVQRGSQVSTPLIPLSLPNTGTAGLSFRLDLPTDGDEAAPIDVQVGAFSRASGEGCLLASGGTRTQPRETASVRLSTVAMLEGCSEGDVVVQSVTPSLVATDQFGSGELVLKGWGFQPDTQIRIDDQLVARLTFVSATEVRVVPGAAKRLGAQNVSAQNQGAVNIARDLLRYYGNQVTYTPMAVPSWSDLGIFAQPSGIAGSALIRNDSGAPRFSLLRSDSSMPGTWDVAVGYRVFAMQGTGIGGPSRNPPGLFTNQLRAPTQVLLASFDIEPLDDVTVLETNRMDGSVPYKVGFRASIAGDIAFVYCSNIQDKTTRMAAIAKHDVPQRSVADLAMAYDDGTIGILAGSSRGIFTGPNTGTANLCERHQPLSAGVITSVQGLYLLRLPPMGVENYLLVANLGKAIYLIPPADSSTTGPEGESVYNHTPYLLADMATTPVSQAVVDDIDHDGLSDLIVLYRRGGQAFIRINRGLPAEMINFRIIAQFDTTQPDLALPNDCAQASPLRLADINEDRYTDILIGCVNSSGLNSIEAVLTRGNPIQFGTAGQTIYQQPKSADGGALYFERMVQDGLRPIELWGANGTQPLRLINTSH